MDFHSLSRRELQALCKKNKIPANLTNVAMADALKALETVEGLEEFTMAHDSESQRSPEKTLPGSPDLPKTACRTSTRRKPKVEPETSQPLTRTRRATRRTVAEEADQENKSVNLPETPAMPASQRRALATSVRKRAEIQMLVSGEDKKEENAVVDFAAMQSCQRRTPAASTRRNKAESSVQKVYSTRRSVRLLEKSMEELSLKDRKRVDAVDSDGFCKEIEEVQEKKAVSEAHLKTTTEDIFEQSNNSEVISCLNLDNSVEDESQMKPELQEYGKNNDNDVDIGSGKGRDFENLSGLSEDDNDERSDESDSLQCRGSEMGVQMNHESVENKVPDVFITGNTETASEVSTPEIDKGSDNEGSSVVQVSDESTEFVMGMVHTSLEEIPHDISGEAMHHIVPAQFSPSNDVKNSVDIEVLPESLVPSEYVGENPIINSTENEQSHNDDLQSNFDIGEESNGKRSGEIQEETDAETAQKEVSNHLVTETNPTNELTDHPTPDKSTVNFKDQMVDCDVEALVDVNVDEAEIFYTKLHDYSTSLDSIKDRRPVEQMNSLCPPFSAGGSSENLVNVCVMQAEEFPVAAYEGRLTVDRTPPSIKQTSPHQTLFSIGGVTQESVFVPFAADTLQGQFPRPSEPTPRKSSSKKQATIQKMVDASEINKENIDSSCTKLEPQKEIFKKADPEHEEISADMSLSEEISADMSLRKLTKMLREKLQIANKNNEEKTFTKQASNNPRLALQTLPENRMSVAEPETKN